MQPELALILMMIGCALIVLVHNDRFQFAKLYINFLSMMLQMGQPITIIQRWFKNPYKTIYGVQ